MITVGSRVRLEDVTAGFGTVTAAVVDVYGDAIGAGQLAVRMDSSGVVIGCLPERLLEVVAGADRLGNLIALEGVDRCGCGSKYWEFDRCIDCGHRRKV